MTSFVSLSDLSSPLSLGHVQSMTLYLLMSLVAICMHIYRSLDFSLAIILKYIFNKECLET